MAPPHNLELRDLLDYQPGGGILRFAGERCLLLDATAFGLLRKEIVETFGQRVAMGLFTRFGFAQGWQLAANLSRQMSLNSERDVWAVGAQFHQLLGLLGKGLEQSGDANGLRTSWQDSFEAEQHLLHFGRSAEQVCWTQCGFASGWLSFFRGEKVYSLEETCRGRGDAACTMVARTAEQWGPDYAGLLASYGQESLDESLRRLAEDLKCTERKLMQINNGGRTSRDGLVAQSPSMSRVLDLADRLAGSDITVLITGESGSGKGAVAKHIHDQSARAKHPFIAINCGALPESLLETELFGHARGAFTGANQARVGLLEAAEGGTLFLDELGDMAPSTQTKVLRALEDRQIRRVGENTSRSVNVRILAATHRDLTKEMAEGRFRKDLYYRLKVMELEIPPLRERLDDILPLARHFLHAGGLRLGRSLIGFEPAAAHQLLRYPWPGNVRELQNAIERALVLASGSRIAAGDLPWEAQSEAAAPGLAGSALTLEEVEKAHILAVLESVHGNRAAAARRLGIGKTTLFRKLQLYRGGFAPGKLERR